MKRNYQARAGFASVAILGASIAVATAQTLPPAGSVPTGEKHKHHRALPWSLTLGKPDIQVGKQVGYFIWHDANFVYVATTDESDKGQIFSGKAGVKDGTITNVSGLHDEKDDRFKQPKPNVVNFHFKTHEGLDGVKFEIGGGAKFVAFKIDLQNHPTSHVFLGKDMKEPEGKFEHGKLVFDLSR